MSTKPPRNATRYKVYDFVAQFIEEHGFPPSYREIMAGVPLSSTSMVAYHLRKLIDEGKLERGPRGLSRALRLAREAPNGNSAA